MYISELPLLFTNGWQRCICVLSGSMYTLSWRAIVLEVSSLSNVPNPLENLGDFNQI